MTIRTAAPADAERIAQIFIESAAQHAALDPERYAIPDREAIEARYRGGLAHRPDSGARAITLVAELNGDIAGFVDLRLEKSADAMHRDILYCEIAEIAVRSDCRSRGIGKRLIEAGEDWGRQQGAQFALLTYHAANTRAGEFYRDRLGYTVASMTAIRRLR